MGRVPSSRAAAWLALLSMLSGCAQGGGLLDDSGITLRDAGVRRDSGRVDAAPPDDAAPDDAAPDDAALDDAGRVDAGPMCTTMADCDDADACTSDACEVGACTHAAVEPPVGSGCGGAIDISAGGTFTGNSMCAASDFAGACSAGDAPDVHFTLTVATTARVTLDSLGTSFDAVLALGSSCLGGELGCDDDAAGGGQARLTRADLGAGTYHVILDGKAGGAGGDWTLNVDIATGPTMEVVAFPSSGDSASTGDGQLWIEGDYVTGSRATSLPDVTGASMTVSIPLNGLTCDTQDMRMMINGVEVSRFSVTPGASSATSSASFASISGPTYVLRYETVRTVSGGCGAAQVGPGGSVTLTR